MGLVGMRGIEWIGLGWFGMRVALCMWVGIMDGGCVPVGHCFSVTSAFDYVLIQVNDQSAESFTDRPHTTGALESFGHINF